MIYQARCRKPKFLDHKNIATSILSFIWTFFDFLEKLRKSFATIVENNMEQVTNMVFFWCLPYCLCFDVTIGTVQKRSKNIFLTIKSKDEGSFNDYDSFNDTKKLSFNIYSNEYLNEMSQWDKFTNIGLFIDRKAFFFKFNITNGISQQLCIKKNWLLFPKQKNKYFSFRLISQKNPLDELNSFLTIINSADIVRYSNKALNCAEHNNNFQKNIFKFHNRPFRREYTSQYIIVSGLNEFKICRKLKD